jgi:hypothetical protein
MDTTPLTQQQDPPGETPPHPAKRKEGELRTVVRVLHRLREWRLADTLARVGAL